MSEAPTTQIDDRVANLDPDVRVALDVLARALRGRTAPLRQVRATGPQPMPAEGLALVQDFIAIEDPALRQALLETVAALAG